MALIQDKQLLLAISITGLIVFALIVWRIFLIGKLYGAERVADAEKATNLLIVVLLICGVIQFLVYEFNLPVVWLALAGVLQWEKYKMRKERKLT